MVSIRTYDRYKKYGLFMYGSWVCYKCAPFKNNPFELLKTLKGINYLFSLCLPSFKPFNSDTARGSINPTNNGRMNAT